MLILAFGTDGGALSGQIITTDIGNPWQGANLLLQDNYLDLTTDKTMTADLYLDVPFNLFARAAAGQSDLVDSTYNVTHTGMGWETLNFDFTWQLDGTLTVNGEYRTVPFLSFGTTKLMLGLIMMNLDHIQFSPFLLIM